MTTLTITTATIENGKATELFDLFAENEFFNFDMKDGDFRTDFVFENLTEDEAELVDDLTESLN